MPTLRALALWGVLLGALCVCFCAERHVGPSPAQSSVGVVPQQNPARAVAGGDPIEMVTELARHRTPVLSTITLVPLHVERAPVRVLSADPFSSECRVLVARRVYTPCSVRGPPVPVLS